VPAARFTTTTPYYLEIAQNGGLNGMFTLSGNTASSTIVTVRPRPSLPIAAPPSPAFADALWHSVR
jgi:hypothetical protein